MARILLDTRFFSEPRHRLLCGIVAKQIQPSLENCVRFRLISCYHECYLRLTDVLSSEEIDIAAGCCGFAEALVASKLADPTDDGRFRIRGVDDRIDSLLKKIASARSGGLRSAEVRRKRYESAQPLPKHQFENLEAPLEAPVRGISEKPFFDKTQNALKHQFEKPEAPFEAPVRETRSTFEANSNPLSLSLSLSLSEKKEKDILDREIYSEKLDQTRLRDRSCDAPSVAPPSAKPKRVKKAKAPTLAVETAEAWAAYEAAYQARYRTTPLRDAKTNSQMKLLVKRIGKSDTPELLKFYVCRCNSSFYVAKRHPIWLALSEAETLFVDWQKGRQITRSEANNSDRTANNYEAALRVIEKIERASNEKPD